MLWRNASSVSRINHLSKKAALEFIRKEDRGRERYLKKYFEADVDDPLLYDLTINIDRITYELAAKLIAEAVLKHG